MYATIYCYTKTTWFTTYFFLKDLFNHFYFLEGRERFAKFFSSNFFYRMQIHNDLFAAVTWEGELDGSWPVSHEVEIIDCPTVRSLSSTGKISLIFISPEN